MYVVCLCAPLGADIKRFMQDFKIQAQSNRVSFAIVDSSNQDNSPNTEFTKEDDLIQRIKTTKNTQFPDLLLVCGHNLLLQENLKGQFDLKCFWEVDADSCLIGVVQTAPKEKLGVYIERYEKFFKPQNEDNIYPSIKHADIIIPDKYNMEVFFSLLNSKLLAQKSPKSCYN